MLPLIKKVTPQSFASQIVGVQPMSQPMSAEKWTIIGESINDYGTIRYWVRTKAIYYVTSRIVNNEYKWCQDTFAPDTWDYNANVKAFFFEQEEDRTLFLLRWS